jgi:hypothetical protein
MHYRNPPLCRLLDAVGKGLNAVGKGNSHRRQMTVCVPFADCLDGSQQRFFLFLFIFLVQKFFVDYLWW